MEQASNSVRKWSLTATLMSTPLLHQRAQLTRQDEDGVTAFRVLHREIPFMNFPSQRPAWYLPELSELASSKFSGQFQIHFSISCHESGLLWWIKLYWSSSTPQSKLIKKLIKGISKKISKLGIRRSGPKADQLCDHITLSRALVTTCWLSNQHSLPESFSSAAPLWFQRLKSWVNTSLGTPPAQQNQGGQFSEK